MASRDGGGSTGPEEEEQNCPRGHNVINQHFHAPVNQIHRADNCNLGVNNGNLTQNRVAGTVPSGSSSGVREPELPMHQCILSGHDVFALLNPVPNASHTRNLSTSPPNSRCFPGTRTQVLRKIRKWVDRSVIRNHPHIMWIYGYAGCGKSAISLAICKHLAEHGRLAASFFFFRGAGDRSNITRFATTVASQVAAAIPATAPLIEAAIKANPGLLTTTETSLGDQFDRLIYQPIDKSVGLAALVFGKPFLIALDGLDECGDHDEVADFIEHMIAFFERKPSIPLRFLITSRVENHIHDCLHSSPQVKLLDLVDHTSDEDILKALEAAIDLKRAGLNRARCAESWPSAEEKARLVKHVGGSFIFLTTIVNFLFDPYVKDKRTPMERLPLVLSMQPDFDGLYRAILEPSKDLPYFQDIVSAIALAQEPLSIAQIAELLYIKPTKVANVLITLHAIMQVPGDDRTAVTLWHTSLRDFLCTAGRAGIFLADYRSIAFWCLSSSFRSASPASSSISDYTNHFTMFHWEEYLRVGSEEEPVNSSTPRELSKLLQCFVKDDCTPLEVAVHSKNWTVVRALAATNADVNVRFKQPQDGIICALHAVCHHMQWDLIYFLLDHGANPNIVSPYSGCIVSAIVDHGEFYHGTTLSFAAKEGNVKLATRLLECGADPNLQGGRWGTALRAACMRSSLEIVNLLLDHGADPNLRGGPNNGLVPLHSCAYHDHDSCARALLMRKADPNLQDSFGDTPLHYACRYGQVKMVECLFEFKADASIRNKQGQTVMQVAQEYNREGVIQVLRRHGIVE